MTTARSGGMLCSCSLVLSVVSLVNGGTFRPHLLDYADLVDDSRYHEGVVHQHFEEALGTDGLLQVSGIPSFANLREKALREARTCIAEAPQAQVHAFPDGTVRRTLAAAAAVTFGLTGIAHGTDTQACQAFERTSQAFRDLVGSVADHFAKRLGGLLNHLGEGSGSALLKAISGRDYRSMEEVVRFGERLEHFHSYQLPEEANTAKQHGQTLDFHVDQGLFIAFAPAMMVGEAWAPAQREAPTGAFAVKSSQGEVLEAELEASALVFLLGDGINRLTSSAQGSVPLRTPSHAFKMPSDAPGLHRVWYGMMQLPPAEAIAEETEGLTFGDIRDRVIKAGSSDGPDAEKALALGCSRQLQARELAATCSETQIYCWHRCYDFTAEVSPDACAARDLGFNCTSQFDQIYVGGHGDFEPRCSNTTELVTPRPPVEQPSGECAEWEALVSDSHYTHRVPLFLEETYLLWNVKEDEKLEAKMIHKGLVGWMATGIENPGGLHNGMNGASIVMGRNVGGASTTVGEYRIHEQMSAFRHWKTPLDPTALADTEMASSGCISSLKFTTATIYGEALNLTSGTNQMLWALTKLDYPTNDFGGYSGYHTATGSREDRPKFRNHVQLDFAGGSVVDGGSETSGAMCKRNLFLLQTVASAAAVASVAASVLFM